VSDRDGELSIEKVLLPIEIRNSEVELANKRPCWKDRSRFNSQVERRDGRADSVTVLALEKGAISLRR